MSYEIPKPVQWRNLPKFATMLVEAAGCGEVLGFSGEDLALDSERLALRRIIEMLRDGEFPGKLRWRPNPGWPPSSPSEHWEEVEGCLETGIFIDDFPRPLSPNKALTEDDLEPVEPVERTLEFELAGCETVCEAYRRRAREMAAPQSKRDSGRSTKRPDIEAAYEALKSVGKIDFDRPMTKSYPKIRFKITGSEELSEDLGDEAIRKVVSPLFKRDKLACKSALEIPNRPQQSPISNKSSRKTPNPE